MIDYYQLISSSLKASNWTLHVNMIYVLDSFILFLRFIIINIFINRKNSILTLHIIVPFSHVLTNKSMWCMVIKIELKTQNKQIAPRQSITNSINQLTTKKDLIIRKLNLKIKLTMYIINWVTYIWDAQSCLLTLNWILSDVFAFIEEEVGSDYCIRESS